MAIDLSDAQSPDRVDCGDTSASAVTDTSGTVSFATRTSSGARITCTASGAEADGDTVTVTVSNVDAGGAQATSSLPRTTRLHRAEPRDDNGEALGILVGPSFRPVWGQPAI